MIPPKQDPPADKPASLAPRLIQALALALALTLFAGCATAPAPVTATLEFPPVEYSK
jgi:hypothetical protein